MKVLVVCSRNSGNIAPFITEQVEALNRNGIQTDYFTIEQKGLVGYLKSRTDLIKKIEAFHPEIIHAHYGLSGLLANLQRQVPVVTTYHGSDINNGKAFHFSKQSICLSRHNIFVSQKNIIKAKVEDEFSLIPCGVDIDLFAPMDKTACRKQLNLSSDKKYILFAGAFENTVKNASLAQYATDRLYNVQLLELKGYPRDEVAKLINAADVCLMTSFTEGSPQFIKEAMACNCPIVTTNVGDVKEVIGNTEGCFVCETYDVNDVAENLRLTLQFGKRTNGRERIEKLGLDSSSISMKLTNIYKQIANPD
ncbi:MAG: glycosyltransferase family 4 protein [Dysgonomonas sp.]